MPPEWQSLKDLTARVCGTRCTHYGSFFKVESKANPSNLAYAPVALDLHTDLPYYADFDVVQLLHCMKQSSEGGDNEFTDAFYAEQILKNEYPEDWKILTETTIEFSDNGQDAYGGFCKRKHRQFFK